MIKRGMQGLTIHMAKALNKLWDRRGKVFAGRFYARTMTTPREVRQVLKYVLLNHKKHDHNNVTGIDPASSGAWFDGWFDPYFLAEPDRTKPAPVAPARSWLLRTGWRQHGPINMFERPSSLTVTGKLEAD